MRRVIVTLGACGLLAGCLVHERAPRYGYGYYGPRHEWRAERREDHWERRNGWRPPEDHD